MRRLLDGRLLAIVASGGRPTDRRFAPARFAPSLHSGGARQLPRPSVPIELRGDLLPALGPGPAEAAERSAETQRARAAIAQLSTDQRDALVLVGLGYSYEEIAERRGWSPAKVHRCLSNGRTRVRAILTEGGNSP